MYFADRYDAAMQLAVKLEEYKKDEGVILAVPRGGVPLGYYLAKHLDFTLDLLMTKKIGHPLNQEYAIGAVGLEDSIIEAADEDIPEEYIEQETSRIRRQLAERYKIFMGDKKPVKIEGKTVIVVDDGIATSRTILQTLKILTNNRPTKLIMTRLRSSTDAVRPITRQ